MGRYIKNKDGKFAGSIGDGRDSVPAPAHTHANVASEGAPAAPSLARALASMRIQTPTLRPGQYVLEVYSDDQHGHIEYCGQRASVSIYGPVSADRVQEWLNDFPADSDLMDLYAVDADDLDAALRELGFDRAGQPVFVNDPTPTKDGFTEGTLCDLPGHQRSAVVTANDRELHLTTTATRTLPPSDAERTIVATAVDDFFDALDEDEDAVAVWQNDVTGVWQVVDRRGIQDVWVGKSFAYCTQFDATPHAITFTLDGGTVLTASRVDGVDPRTIALAIDRTQPRTQAEWDAVAGVLHAMTPQQQVDHYVSSAGQRSLVKRLDAAMQRVRR